MANRTTTSFLLIASASAFALPKQYIEIIQAT